MKSKTYGVRGLMEWKVSIPTGRPVMSSLEINFEGGQLTGYGVSPARYTTSDPYVQRLIENSRWFRNGKIFLLTTRQR